MLDMAVPVIIKICPLAPLMAEAVAKVAEALALVACPDTIPRSPAALDPFPLRIEMIPPP